VQTLTPDAKTVFRSAERALRSQIRHYAVRTVPHAVRNVLIAARKGVHAVRKMYLRSVLRVYRSAYPNYALRKIAGTENF
jgi:hypothetical protein